MIDELWGPSPNDPVGYGERVMKTMTFNSCSNEPGDWLRTSKQSGFRYRHSSAAYNPHSSHDHCDMLCMVGAAIVF